MFVFRLFVNLMALNALLVFVVLNTISVKNLVTVITESRGTPLYLFLLVLMVIDLLFAVSQKGLRGVKKIHLSIVLMIAVFLWALVFFAFVEKNASVFKGLEGFTKIAPSLVRVSPM